MANGSPSTLSIENFPAELRRRLRVHAAKRNTTMRQLLIDAGYGVCDELDAEDAQRAEVAQTLRS